MRVCAMPLVFSIYNEKISGAGAVSSSMCSIPGAQISESNTADTAVEEGGDQINTHPPTLQLEDLVGVMPSSAVVKHAMSFCP